MEQLFFGQYGPLILLIALWGLIWKGIALWHAAHAHERKWFIILLIANTAGLLETAYLFHKRRERLLLWPLIVSALLLGYLFYTIAQRSPL